MSIEKIAAADYHADPDGPTLSSSIAKLIVQASPLHAWTAHPRLNPDWRPDDRSTFDMGRVIHGVFLEGQAAVEIIDAPDYKTKAAQEARDAARAAGKTPILTKQWPDVQRAVLAVSDHLLVGHKADPPLFRDGQGEVCVRWNDAGVECRALLDWLRDDRLAVDDLKCTTRSANPRQWARQLFSLGYDMQAEFYTRGVELLTGVRPVFRLAVVEISPPYAVSVIGLSPDAQVLARKKVDLALEVWRRCMDSGEWPGYPADVAYATLPAWEESAWLDFELELEARGVTA